MAKKAIAFCLILAVSCNDDPGPVKDVTGKFPLFFEFEGYAEGHSEGRDIECICEMFGELDSNVTMSMDTTIYRGTMGGSISRVTLDPDGNGFSLTPDLFGEIQIRVYSDSVKILTPINLGTGSRFYDGIALFKGKLKGEVISGTWTCAPFDISEGGWVDTLGVVQGSWRIKGIEPN